MPNDDAVRDHATSRLGTEDARRDTARIAAEILGMAGSTDPFAAAVRATRMPMVITNPRLPDNPIVFANDAFCRLSGYPRAEILNRNCRFLQCDQTDQQTVARIRAAVQAGRSIEIEIRNQRRDGQLFWNRLLLAPVQDAEGQTAYFFASQVDITLERERLEGLEFRNEALLTEVADRLRAQEDSEARLRFATKAGLIGIWELDWQSRELTLSAFCRKVFGDWPAQPFTYDAMLAAISPNDRQRVEDAFERSFATGTDLNLDYMVTTPEGREGWVDVRAQVALGSDGRPLRMSGIALDSTERRRVENDLAFSEQRLRLSTDVAEIGTWDLDLRTDVLTWPARTKAMFGISPDVACSMADFYAGLHPDDRSHTTEHFLSAIDPQRRTTYDVEYRTIGKEDGIVRWVAARGRGLFDEAGHCVRAIGTAIDITDRKLAEERQLALLQLDSRLRELDEPAAMAAAAAETLGTTLRADRAGYARCGDDPDAVTVEPDWTATGIQSIAGPHRLGEYGRFLANLQQGETVVFADVASDPSTADRIEKLAAIGTKAFINVPVFEGGCLVALFFVHSRSVRQWSAAEVAFVRALADRTRTAIERRRAERALQDLAASLERQVETRTAELQLYRNIVQSDRSPVCAFDANFSLIAFNQAHSDEFFRIFGHRVQLGEVFPDLFLPEQAPVIRGFMARALAGESFMVVEEFGDPDLAKPAWEVSYNPLRDEAGRIIGAFHHATDVSGRLRAQAALAAAQGQLRQSQKMEAVGQLTGGLAHDFNNLLTGISGSLELLQTRVAQGRVKDVDRYINAAQGAARRAAALTHRLLAFSRQQTLAPKPTDVNRLVAGMEELISRTMGPQIRIEPVAGGGLWTTLIDPSQLENALLNLCINARDAMPDGGKLCIETGNRWLDERAASERDLTAGQYISLCVSDNGVGMPPDVIARAFDPFFTTKPIGQGTGLGLSMIYGFVRQSGGQVRIYSEVGQGTMVCLYLPRHLGKDETADLPAEMLEAPRAEQGETVLIVDDEATVRMLVTEILEELGYTAIEATDGPAGLKVLQSEMRIDLLVTDVGLPGGMNGRQLAEIARISRPELKVLFITGYAENAVLSHGHLESGMQVMTKPFAMEALATRIHGLIEGGR